MYKVLLADDIEPFRRKIKRFPCWKAKGHAFEIVYEAPNGLEALEMLKKHAVDVLLTDIRMPLINGIDLLKEVKKKNLCPCVILFSEFAEFSYAKEGIINGAFDYLVKPVDEEALMNTFHRVRQYLDSLSGTPIPVETYKQQLIYGILHGEKKKCTRLCERIFREMAKGAEEESQLLLTVYDFADEMMQKMLDEQPYLSFYFSLEDFTVFSAGNGEEAEAKRLLCDFVLEFCARMEIFRIDHYSENVQKLCLMAFGHVEDKLNLTRIAEEFYMNPKYLGSKFKQETGLSFNQFLTNLKIYRAKKLLKQEKSKIAEVAERLGFENVAYFSKVFKKETGQSPGEYRRKAE